jgi:hypothetical protein
MVFYESNEQYFRKYFFNDPPELLCSFAERLPNIPTLPPRHPNRSFNVQNAVLCGKTISIPYIHLQSHTNLSTSTNCILKNPNTGDSNN